MGCAQASPSVIPLNNQIPIERMFTNDDYSLAHNLPVVMITAPPPPMFVKSALRKTPFDGRGRTEKRSLFNRKLPSLNKSVNFDEQVLVKARTPTPTKIWYEKSSSTMPMRKTPPNDDDDFDYDEGEMNSVSSDEEEEEEQYNDDESQDIKPKAFKLRPPTPLSKRNQDDSLWPQTNTVGVLPQINPLLENQSFSPPMRRSSVNMNISTPETPTPPLATRIKVRRRLPEQAPPQIVSIPSYQSPVQPPIVSPYQSPVRLPIVPPYQSPVQPPIISPYPSAVKPPSQVFPLQRITSNPLPNGESSPQTPYYPINRHSIENVT